MKNHLLDNKCERIYKDQLKHYFHSGLEKHEIENVRPTTRRSANYNKQTVQALENKRGLHNPQRGPTLQKTLCRNGSINYYQSLIPQQLVDDVVRRI